MGTITSDKKNSGAPGLLAPLPRSNSLLPRLIPVILLGITLIMAVGVLMLDWPSARLIDIVCWLIVLITIWMLWSWQRITGTVFDPYGLFVLAAVAFNGGQAILEVLNLNPNGVLEGRFSPETTITALLCVALGLMAMQIGALFAVRRWTWIRSVSGRWTLDPASLGSLRAVGWILLGVSIVPTVSSLLQALSVVSQAGYFGLYQQEAGVGLGASTQILAGFFVPAVLLMLVGSGSSRGYTLMSVVLIGLYSGITLILGARYSAAAPMVAYAWLWHRCKRPLPRKILIGGAALVLFIVFPIIRTTRTLTLTERSSIETFINSESEINPATASLSEMGGTLMTVAYTIDLVPTVRPYDYGLQYGYDLLTIVPNFVWDVHPTIARGTPSTWLVRLVAPDTAAAGGGYGFSFIAEAYLNFGFWGAPLMLLFIGYLYARFVAWAIRTNDAAKIAMVGIYFAAFLVYARSDGASIIRPLFWYAWVPYLLIQLLRGRQSGVAAESTRLER